MPLPTHPGPGFAANGIRLERLVTKLLAFLAALFLTGTASGQCLRIVNVSNSSGLASAVASALPGDCIVLANGNYSGVTVAKSGTSGNPITISAANQGQAVISSGIFTPQV